GLWSVYFEGDGRVCLFADFHKAIAREALVWLFGWSSCSFHFVYLFQCFGIHRNWLAGKRTVTCRIGRDHLIFGIFIGLHRYTCFFGILHWLAITQHGILHRSFHRLPAIPAVSE